MPEENVAKLKQGFERLRREGAIDLGLIDPEIEILNFDTFPVTRPYHGHEGLAKWMADMSEPFDEFNFELVKVLADADEQVVVALRASGSSRSGGPPFALEWGAVYTFREGRVIRAEGFRTGEEALRAAGLDG
jgi:ketosteroid isomerase-like protein